MYVYFYIKYIINPPFGDQSEGFPPGAPGVHGASNKKIVNLLSEIKYNEQHVTFFNKKNITLFLNKLEFKNIFVSTNMFLSPFFAIFDWEISDIIQKFEDKFLNHPFRLFLFVVCSK